MDPIERVVAHFESLEPDTVTVPEWVDENGKPLVIYLQPMELEQVKKIRRVEGKGGPTESAIEIMIQLACNEDGSKMFTLEHKPTFRRKSAALVVGRVSRELMEAAEAIDPLDD